MYNEKMRANLIELLSREIFPREGIDPAEVVADYLLDNGVIVKPAKEGDTVYVHNNGEIKGYTICKSSYERDQASFYLPVHVTAGCIAAFPISWSDIGKTAFLSREDAESALAEKEKM